jgi:hypothetical protein
VADVKNPPHFGVDLLGVVEIRIFPGDRVPDRRLETAFAHEMPLPCPVFAADESAEFERG